jgi:hypothetical protein
MKKISLFVFVLATFIYARPATDWCGTIPALEEYRAGIRRARPTLSGPVIYIEDTNFRVHYTTQGSDAVSPAYAETVASAMRYSWAKLVDTLGFAPPPPDYNQGGDDRYDIYVKVLPSGIAGVTYSENSYPNPYPDGVCSHFRIALDMGNNYLKSTVCHEFHHAIQFRYSNQEGSWWMENSATWSEEVVYPEYNDYLGFLSTSPGPFTTPEYPINTFDNVYQYAGCVWPMYLTERFGDDVVHQIWTYQGTIAGQNTLSGMEHILTTQCSSNMINALKEYSIWRYFTGSRADTVNYYREAHFWPQVRISHNHNSYPASGDQGNYPVSNPGGTTYIQFQNGGGDLMVCFNAQSVYRWKCNLVGYRPNGLSSVHEINLNASGAGGDTLPWGENDHFVLIPLAAQWEYSTGALPYSYTAGLDIVNDVGVTQLTGFLTMVDSSAVLIPQAVVKNFGTNYASFPLTLSVGDFYLSSFNLNLNAGDSAIVNFPSCTMLVRSYQDYKCKVNLANDQRRTNDSITGRTFVRVRDVGVTSIVAPVGNITQGSMIQPRAMIKNYGNLRENFDVEFHIGAWSATQRLGLNAGLEFEYVFDSIWYANPVGNYSVKCSTKLANDVNLSNDYAVASCNVTASAIDEQTIGIKTNPVMVLNRNQIDIIGISDVSKVDLDIFDIQGKKMYTEQSNTLPIYIRKSLPSGCYIIRVKTDDLNLFGKTVIINN